VAGEAARLNVVDLVDVDARTDPRWQELQTRARGSLFHSSAWASVLTDTYRFAPRALLALDGDRAVSGIPWCRVDDPRGPRIISLPFSDYCGPIGAPPLGPLIAELARGGLPVRWRVLVDPDAPADDYGRITGRARWHGILVTATPESDAWPELASSARRAVVKARREGVVVV